MRNLASLLVPCALVVAVGCGPGPTCGADLVYNETTGLCDCLTGGTWGDDGYCRYADGAITLPDGAVPMADASADEDGGLPDAGPLDAAPDACVTSTFYRDADGDGHGAETDSVTACVAPDGYVESDDDCNDTCETCLPGGTEICTEPALDEDCDGDRNEDCACTNGTSISCGATEVGECAYGTQLCVAGAYATCEGAIGPVDEDCNGVDDDCDGTVDEGVEQVFYRDCDGDTYAPSGAMPTTACEAPTRLPSCGAGDSSGWTTRVPSTGSVDCRDNNELVHPGQSGFFTIPIAGTDSYDYNCDGTPSRAVERLGACVNNPSLGCLPNTGWTSWIDGDWPDCGVTHTDVIGCTSGCARITSSSTQACR